ncbi:MAG: amino acid adenylation domain-containing protein [Lachnospiraceae bacterium]|nr:amino acid adenylation domain-containing protein [Lachnospiraceae bacterium]
MINVLEMLEETAARIPDHRAFTDPGKSITYGELLRKARSIGTAFAEGRCCRPLGPGDAVAFYMEKSVDAVVMMLGAVYAGACYSFIDVRQTPERAGAILEVLEAPLVITDEENEEAARKLAEGSRREVRLQRIEELVELASHTPASEELLSKAGRRHIDTDPLYVNFTSGSTGIPKGVAVGHRSVLDFIWEFTRIFQITEGDILANQAPFDFDVSVKDIYSALLTGAEVLLIPRPYFSNPSVLMDYLADHEVTVLIWAVSAMCFVSIMNGLEYRKPERIRQVMFSGEMMPVKQLNKWKKSLPDAVYVNLYGPTEITCNCTYYVLDRDFENDEMIPAGIPFPNERVFLLDDKDGLVEEEGKEGEICVSGSCLALGYYKDPEKTGEVFVQNPLNHRHYERIYRTGDLGKYDSAGNLVFTSRKDFQIKHMGQRIELGDIEASAQSVEGVQRACCLYDAKRKKIVLFYAGEAEKEGVSEALHQKLPSFMLPGKTVRLEEFPLNKNGKIDRNALSAML